MNLIRLLELHAQLIISRPHSTIDTHSVGSRLLLVMSGRTQKLFTRNQIGDQRRNMTSDTYLASILARIIPEIVLLRTRVALLEGKSPQGAADDVDELLISRTGIEPPWMTA